MFGLDYTNPNPDWAHALGSFKALKVGFVARYLAPEGPSLNWKRLTLSEVHRYRSAGIAVVTVFETSAARAMGGNAAGVYDAKAAQAHLNSVGLPHNVVFFAVDFDASPSEQSAINSYLRGAAGVLGANRVGIYGGYWPVKRALEAGAAKYGWQTYAWSGGLVYKGAQLYQFRNGQAVGGIGDTDYDKSLAADFGQSNAPTHKKAHKPRPWLWKVVVTVGGQSHVIWSDRTKHVPGWVKLMVEHLAHAKLVRRH